MVAGTRVLILEDQARDAELTIYELIREGIPLTWVRVEEEPEFIRQIREFLPDLILADYSLPGYDGLSALATAKKECPGIPFIIVSAAIGEELAVEAMKCGATDYVLKQRLSRLAPAVRRALQEVEEKKKLGQALESQRVSESLYRSLVENLPQHVFRKDCSGRFTFANGRFCHLLGASADQILGKTDVDFYPVELAEKYQSDDRHVMETGETFEGVEEHLTPTGQRLYVEVVKSPLYDTVGKVIGIQTIFWDVTEKQQLEAQFLRAQRLESVGHLAGGLAHDLNNILAPISMGISMLEEEIKSAEGQALLQTMSTSVQRGAEITQQVLAFARGLDGRKFLLQPRHLIKEWQRS